MSVSDDTDKELVRRLLRGDDEAFRTFFDWMFPRVYRFAIVRVGGREDAAEDIAQATLCRAVQRIATWRGEAALFTWLCTICRHEIETWRRAHAPVEEVHLLEDAPEIRAALEMLRQRTLPSEAQRIEREHIAILVQRILDHLPVRYGRALEWKYLDEVPVREIAARLDLSEKAAESLLTRARAAFRSLVATIAPELAR